MVVGGIRAERMEPVDVAWLHMDRPANLMVVNTVLWFDAPVDLASVLEMFGQRVVARFRRFRQRAADPALTLAPWAAPEWVDDAGFALADHVSRTRLAAPGDQRALQRAASDLAGRPLRKDRPLWELHLLDGYGDGGALLLRTHHAIADGAALMQVLLSLADPLDAGEHTGVLPVHDDTPGPPLLPGPGGRTAGRAIAAARRAGSAAGDLSAVLAAAPTGAAGHDRHRPPHHVARLLEKHIAGMGEASPDLVNPKSGPQITVRIDSDALEKAEAGAVHGLVPAPRCGFLGRVLYATGRYPRNRVRPGPVGRGEHVQVRPGQPTTVSAGGARNSGAGYRGLTSAGAPLISPPAASSPAAVRTTRQARSSASATSGAAAVITMTTRTSSRPRRTSESTLGPMTVVLCCPASSRPDSPRTAPRCRQPSVRGTVRRTWKYLVSSPWTMQTARDVTLPGRRLPAGARPRVGPRPCRREHGAALPRSLRGAGPVSGLP